MSYVTGLSCVNLRCWTKLKIKFTFLFTSEKAPMWIYECYTDKRHIKDSRFNLLILWLRQNAIKPTQRNQTYLRSEGVSQKYDSKKNYWFNSVVPFSCSMFNLISWNTQHYLWHDYFRKYTFIRQTLETEKKWEDSLRGILFQAFPWPARFNRGLCPFQTEEGDLLSNTSMAEIKSSSLNSSGSFDNGSTTSFTCWTLLGSSSLWHPRLISSSSLKHHTEFLTCDTTSFLWFFKKYCVPAIPDKVKTR